MASNIFLFYMFHQHIQSAQDFGGPRKEFFRLVLREIKEIYFDNGLRELLSEKYYIIGIIFGMSTNISCIEFKYVQYSFCEIVLQAIHSCALLFKVIEISQLKMWKCFTSVRTATIKLYLLLHSLNVAYCISSKWLLIMAFLYHELANN